MANHRMTKSAYAEYLASDHWQNLRKARIEEEPACQQCSLPRWLAIIAYDQDLHLHHETYRNVGAEEPDDLEVLCRRCHEVETFGRSDLREPKSATCGCCQAKHWNPYAAVCKICDCLIGIEEWVGPYLNLKIPGSTMLIWQDILRSIFVYLDCSVDPILDDLAKLEKHWALIAEQRASGGGEVGRLIRGAHAKKIQENEDVRG